MEGSSLLLPAWSHPRRYEKEVGQRVNFGECTGKKKGRGTGCLLGYSYGVSKTSGVKVGERCIRQGETVWMDWSGWERCRNGNIGRKAWEDWVENDWREPWMPTQGASGTLSKLQLLISFWETNQPPLHAISVYLYAHLSVDNLPYLPTPNSFSQGITFINTTVTWQQWCPNSKRPGNGSRESTSARKEKG